ncbi:MAG: hypothetical protein NVS4B3_14370 [Gemmatimonadaceae bacterium]
MQVSDRRAVYATVIRGAKWGLLFAAVVNAIFTAVVLAHAIGSHGRGIGKLWTSIGAIFFEGPLAGALVGLCVASIRWRVGAVLVATIYCIPLFWVGTLLLFGAPWRGAPNLLPAAIVAAVIAGGILGFRHPVNSSARTGPPEH